MWSAALYLGDEAPPALDRYRYRYVSKKYLLCRKKARKISFVSKKCVKTFNPCFDVEFCADHFIVWGPHAYFDGFRSKNIFLCQKKARKYLFVSKKCVKPDNTSFGVEFRADHFIVWGPHAYFDGFRSKNIFLCEKKARNYLFVRKNVSSRIIHHSA